MSTLDLVVNGTEVTLDIRRSTLGECVARAIRLSNEGDGEHCYGWTVCADDGTKIQDLTKHADMYLAYEPIRVLWLAA